MSGCVGQRRASAVPNAKIQTSSTSQESTSSPRRRGSMGKESRARMGSRFRWDDRFVMWPEGRNSLRVTGMHGYAFMQGYTLFLDMNHWKIIRDT